MLRLISTGWLDRVQHGSSRWTAAIRFLQMVRLGLVASALTSSKWVTALQWVMLALIPTPWVTAPQASLTSLVTSIDDDLNLDESQRLVTPLSLSVESLGDLTFSRTKILGEKAGNTWRFLTEQIALSNCLTITMTS